jgi:hypothetical protein
VPISAAEIAGLSATFFSPVYLSSHTVARS